MRSQPETSRLLRGLSTVSIGARCAVPVFALYACGGSGSGGHSTQELDSGDDQSAVVVQHDAAGQANSPDASDSSVDAIDTDGASREGAPGYPYGDDSGGDESTGDGALEAGDNAEGGDATASRVDGGSAEASDAEGGSADAESGDGAADGASSDATSDAGPACDSTAKPKDDACVLDGSYGLFVAATMGGIAPVEAGADGGDAGPAPTPDGSPSRPFPSITLALQHLGSKSRIYICDGGYEEQVTITTPVSLFGGLACAGAAWRWDGGITEVGSPSPNYALSITGLNNAAIDVQDLTFVAPSATKPGASSIAAIIAASSVTLTRVVLEAGRGANGANGVTGPTNYPAGSMSAAGNPYPGTSNCANGDTSTGGTGGANCAYGCPDDVNGSDGSAIPSPPRSLIEDGIGGACSTLGGTAMSGDDGTNGQARSGGGPAASVGAISGYGWLPSSGADGLPGSPGQGGGGGGAELCYLVPKGVSTQYFAGGGGGAGGCGGAGGLGGGGGGASIALLSINNSSPVALVSSTLTASQGGIGGVGGQGEDGQAGAAGFFATSPAPGTCTCSAEGACTGTGAVGGIGGYGAGGSGGGGGTGGISVGVLYRGVEPTEDANTGITQGLPGGPGAGGLPGSQTLNFVGNSGLPGLPGIAKPFLGGL